jgi:serine/threonine-protein kinase
MGNLISGKYELVEKAGEGGMATVWRAIMHGAAGFSRFVAIKSIRPNLLTNREFIEMFVEEARVGSQLQHSNIIQTYDFGQDARGIYFLVLEWVEGLDLRRFLDAHQRSGKRCEWAIVAAIAVEALRGLGAAHERVDGLGNLAPVIHRDVAPGNILIGTNGIVKLSDFGLARAVDRLQMTHPDVIKGKLQYLAPEITYGKQATVQSDIFSLAIVVWEALADRPLYSGETDVEVFQLAQRAEIPPLQRFRQDLPEELVAVLGRALSKEPEQRYATAKEMLRDLTRTLRLVEHSNDAYAISHAVLAARGVLGLPEPRVVPPPST